MPTSIFLVAKLKIHNSSMLSKPPSELDTSAYQCLLDCCRKNLTSVTILFKNSRKLSGQCNSATVIKFDNTRGQKEPHGKKSFFQQRRHPDCRDTF